jgi:peptidoglycan hydrolase CwlO-like protein
MSLGIVIYNKRRDLRNLQDRRDAMLNQVKYLENQVKYLDQDIKDAEKELEELEKQLPKWD